MRQHFELRNRQGRPLPAGQSSNLLRKTGSAEDDRNFYMRGLMDAGSLLPDQAARVFNRLSSEMPAMDRCASLSSVVDLCQISPEVTELHDDDLANEHSILSTLRLGGPEISQAAGARISDFSASRFKDLSLGSRFC